MYIIDEEWKRKYSIKKEWEKIEKKILCLIGVI